jgi:hypothetical protein
MSRPALLRSLSATLVSALAANLLPSVLALPSTAAMAATAAEVAAELRMAEESQPMKRAADRFIALALAGDASGTSAMLSHALVERIGEASAAKAMHGAILPFFAGGGEVGRSVTITRTTDAAGQQGYAFYLWLVPARGGEAKPFTVYMVDERGTSRVANVVPNVRVAGRHLPH